MQGLGVAAIVVVVAAVASCVGASAARPGLSFCSESTHDNLRITKDMKPELGLIQVLVNNTWEKNVVDEVFIRHQTPCEVTSMAEVVHLDGEDARLMMQDGEISLYWRPPDTFPIFQKIDDFCISALRDSPEGPWRGFLAKFCFPIAMMQMENDVQSCSEKNCVRKCCPPRMSLARDSMCSPLQDGEGWQPSLASGEPDQAATELHMLYGPPRHCVNALIYQEFSIQPSGLLKMGELSADVQNYCIDAFDDPLNVVALVCDKQVTSWLCEFKYTVLKPVLLGVSSVCLVIVFLVYISVARLRSLNEGRCLLSLVSALFVASVTLIILNFTVEGEASLSCMVVARLCHFTLLASYFWMNVLSFHAFVQLRSQLDGKWEKPLVFCLYSLYAWGCPLLVMVVGMMLDAVQADAIRPHIDFNCWFYDTSALWAYLYGPMVVLLLVNSGFFVGCVVLLSCGRGRRVTFTPSSSQQYTFSAWVYVRLFILMGILWLTEVVSWHYLSYCSIPEWIFDITNSLQGVLVFLVTVCCRRDLKVFHCGRPQLIPRGKHSEVTSTTDASEMAANPLVK